MAVFSTTYDGGDFCAGLVFGMNGADMLTKIAKAAFDTFISPKPVATPTQSETKS